MTCARNAPRFCNMMIFYLENVLHPIRFRFKFWCVWCMKSKVNANSLQSWMEVSVWQMILSKYVYKRDPGITSAWQNDAATVIGIKLHDALDSFYHLVVISSCFFFFAFRNVRFVETCVKSGVTLRSHVLWWSVLLRKREKIISISSYEEDCEEVKEKKWIN